MLGWFTHHGRRLPWRDTQDPYLILVSEMMLQQTQVSRVLPYYARFTDAFPSCRALAESSTADVLRLWQGLGYNRRAIYLHRAIQTIAREYHGQFPTALSEIEKLPGVGKYTARAVACFAFDAQVAVVETNVRRAICGFALEHDFVLRPPDVDVIATAVLPVGRAWQWNQALMDFGALAVRRTANDTQNDRQTSATRKPATKFEDTDRYWRGRIIASLCDNAKPVSVGQLLSELPSEADQYRVRDLAIRMRHEGLIDFNEEADQLALRGLCG